MAEEKYPLIVKLNLPPEAQYASGHSLIIQGNNAEDVAKQIEGIVALPDSSVGKTVLKRFVEHGLFGAVKEAMAAEKAQKTAPSAKPDSKPASAEEDSEPATPALLKAVAKKTGKTVEELGSMTKDQAKAALKGAK